jgi:hypothetical protein
VTQHFQIVIPGGANNVRSSFFNTWTLGLEAGKRVLSDINVKLDELDLNAARPASALARNYLLCSPKVTHHHDQLGGVLPPGKSVILPPGKCSVRACPVHLRSRIACAGGQFLLRPQHVTRPWRG